MIIIFSVSILGIGGMMNHAVKMHELEQQKGTREYYSGEKPATSFPLQNVFANLNPFQQDPKKIEVSLLDPKNQDNEALYYRSLMGIIETQIDLRDSAYQFSVPIDESMTRDICSSKYSVLEGLKGNGLPLGPEMNEKLNRMTTNMQC